MQINKSLFFLRGLNKKILFFFILFAFVPLVVFSILGYFLNKTMLSEIAYENLYRVNAQYAKRIQYRLLNDNDIHHVKIGELVEQEFEIESGGIKYEIYISGQEPVLTNNIIDRNFFTNDYLKYYNNSRLHLGLGLRTPAERFQAID